MVQLGFESRPCQLQYLSMLTYSSLTLSIRLQQKF